MQSPDHKSSIAELYRRSFRAAWTLRLIRPAVSVWLLTVVASGALQIPPQLINYTVGAISRIASDAEPAAPSAHGPTPSGAGGSRVPRADAAPPSAVCEPIATDGLAESPGTLLSARCSLPVTYYMFTLRTPTLPLGVQALVALLLMVFGTAALRYLADSVTQSARQRLKRGLQRPVLRALLRDVERGAVLETGKVQHALDTSADTVAGVLTDRARQWLEVVFSAAQALFILWGSGWHLALAVLAWGLTLTLVLPRLPFGRLVRNARPGPTPGGEPAVAPPESSLRGQRRALGKEQVEVGVRWQTLRTEVAVGLSTIVSLHAGDAFEDEIDEVLRKRDLLAARSRSLTAFNNVTSGLAQSTGFIGLLLGIVMGRAISDLLNIRESAQRFVGELQKGGAAHDADVDSAFLLEDALSNVERGLQVSEQTVRTEPPEVEFDALSLQVAGQDGTRTLISSLTLTVEPGSIVKIVGPTGSGKSSLLRMLSGQMRIAGGRVRVGDATFDPSTAVALLSSIVSVTQFSQLFSRSVRENVLLACPKPVKSLEEAARLACLDETAESRVLERPDVHTLSGGERKRVMLARAFVRPLRPIVLLDEIDSGLDAETARRVYANVREWVRGKATCFVVTHQPDALTADITLRLDGAGGVEIARA